jgi:hypothetical protein
LIFSGDELDSQTIASNSFPDKVIVNLNVLGTSMEDRINRQVGSTQIITPEARLFLETHTKFMEKCFNPD